MDAHHLTEPDVHTIDAGTPLHRVHRAVNSPAFFDVGPDGRFNPPDELSDVFGTLYLAFDPAGAFVEALGRTRHLRTTTIDERRLSTVTFSQPLRVFAVDAPTNRFYRGFDLADEAIATSLTVGSNPGDDYARARELAGVVHTAGLAGLVYPARHDNAMLLRSVAVFGLPGNHTPDDIFATCTTEAIPPTLVDEMIRRYRFEVLSGVALPE